MPEMNGLECLEEINKMDNKPNIIIISAMRQVQLVQKAIMLGVKGFIVKPYNDADVVSQLKAFKNTNP
jgi:two-component system, chemotaxis family, chemotaxis protein CheY